MTKISGTDIAVNTQNGLEIWIDITKKPTQLTKWMTLKCNNHIFSDVIRIYRMTRLQFVNRTGMFVFLNMRNQ